LARKSKLVEDDAVELWNSARNLEEDRLMGVWLEVELGKRLTEEYAGTEEVDVEAIGLEDLTLGGFFIIREPVAPVTSNVAPTEAKNMRVAFLCQSIGVGTGSSAFGSDDGDATCFASYPFEASLLILQILRELKWKPSSVYRKASHSCNCRLSRSR
jgi:hypothetical protein